MSDTTITVLACWVFSVTAVCLWSLHDTRIVKAKLKGLQEQIDYQRGTYIDLQEQIDLRPKFAAVAPEKAPNMWGK